MSLFQGFPCHLYLDLEFNRKDNADGDGDEMVDLLIYVILEALLDKFSIQGCHEWIVQLDSSTDGMISTKNARYVVFLYSFW